MVRKETEGIMFFMSKKPEGPHYDVGIGDMVCDLCASHLADALRRVPKVTDAKVTLKTESAIVHGPQGLEETIKEAIEKTGYVCKYVKYVD